MLIGRHRITTWRCAMRWRRQRIERFYQNHFIPKCPKDTKPVPISRTIGADRLVDEMFFCFTHDIEIDWMLPSVEPTGKYVEVPLVPIVNFRGDKSLPMAGIEAAKKLVDETLPSTR
jgi:carboxymethylenebutenolidase